MILRDAAELLIYMGSKVRGHTVRCQSGNGAGLNSKAQTSRSGPSTSYRTVVRRPKLRHSPSTSAEPDSSELLLVRGTGQSLREKIGLVIFGSAVGDRNLVGDYAFAGEVILNVDMLCPCCRIAPAG